MRYTIVFIVFMFLYATGNSQQVIGLEVRTSRNLTFNSGELEGVEARLTGTTVHSEDNPWTKNKSTYYLWNLKG